ncbi:MAG TPA: glucose 1-dehydrogenase [Sporichthyaceae bacterium]|jgi:threonine dehydrogenase-like Zn-dependent dehydrogenase|nr:glucose 1-dehydrogenase [Sporichthyaceae bacterium]
MKACTVKPGALDTAGVEDIAEPSADDGSVLVEGLYVGICGTDLEVAREGYGRPPEGHERIVLFHESLGRVLEAPADSGLAAGDLVAGVVRRPDPEPCVACAADRWDFCRNGGFTERGIAGRDGYGAQRWRVDPKFAIRLDPSLGRLGVLLEPTSVVAKAWDQVGRIAARSPGEARVALVTGAGPIGLLAAMIGRQRGLKVNVLDRVTEGPKPGMVAELGARYLTSLDDLTEPPDVVIEATGIGSLVFDVLGRAAPDAVVCLTGISAGAREIPLAADAINKALVLSNEVVFGSVNAGLGDYAAAAAALASADPDWLAKLISRTVPMKDWPGALERQPGDIKVVVDLQAD